MAERKEAHVTQLAQVGHLTPLEQRLAVRMGAELGAIKGPPVAAIVGEMPGFNTSPKLPVFPLPTTSAGGRLLAYSGMTLEHFLGAFYRRNLYTYLEPWSVPNARDRAAETLAVIEQMGLRRVVLLGIRVGAAFGLDELWCDGRSPGGTEFAVVPHPSGLNRVYNDLAAIRRARATLRWAAGLRRTLP